MVYLFMYRIIINQKTAGDQAVTNMYLNIIRSAITKNFYECEIGRNAKGLNKKKDVLVFDECKVAFKYIIRGYKNIFVWTQGIVPEEAIMQGYPIYRYWIHSMFKFITLKKAKLVFLCSNAMKQHYEHKYNIKLSEKCIIMPCFNEECVDEKSFMDSNKYKNNTFLYVGSLNAWQCFDETVELYKKIEEKTNGNSKLYVFTNEKEKAVEILSRFSINNYEVGYVPACELGKKLKSIKYGFVLRKECAVNNVATPTKISNYLSHGIIPIYSSCLKSFDDFNKRTGNNGLVFDINNTDIDTIISEISAEKNISIIKKWCYNAFKTYYNKEKYIAKIARKIKKISF